MKQFKQYAHDVNDDKSVNIRGLEIFRLGRHKGFPYTKEWAKEAIGNFEKEKKDGFFPSVIIGHNKEGQADEKPARGFLDNLVVKGNEIVTDLVKIPAAVFEELKNRAYPHRSVEVNPDKKRINALALLGGTAPFHKLPIMEFLDETDDEAVVIDHELFAQVDMDELREKFGGKCFKCKSKKKLQFAHVRKTGLSGRGRGQKARYYDIMNHPKSYRLLCEDCHQKYERNEIKMEDDDQFKIDVQDLLQEIDFQEVDLKAAIDMDTKLRGIRQVWWKVTDFIDKVLYDKDKDQKTKKKEIKNLLNQGSTILKTEINKFNQGDKTMSEKQFTDEDLQNAKDQGYVEKFQNDFGMSPEEYKKKLQKEAGEKFDARVKAIADKLKKRNIAPAIIDEAMVPFMQQLPQTGTVKFQADGKTVEMDHLNAFEEMLEQIFQVDQDGKLIVDLSEKSTGPGGDKMEDQFEGDAADRQAIHEKALKAAEKETGKTEGDEFDAAYEKAVVKFQDDAAQKDAAK